MNNLETKQERYNILVSDTLQKIGTIVVSAYQIGTNMIEVKKEELYLLEFRTFDEFIDKKLKVGRSTVYNCMTNARIYTFNWFVKWGSKKLELINRKIENEEDRKDFVANVQPVGFSDLPQQIERFKGRIGKPSKDSEENKLKSHRQFAIVIEHYDSTLETIKGLQQEFTNWIEFSESYNSDVKVSQNLEKAKFIYKSISEVIREWKS